MRTAASPTWFCAGSRPSRSATSYRYSRLPGGSHAIRTIGPDADRAGGGYYGPPASNNAQLAGEILGIAIAAGITAIQNRGPSMRAQKVANEVAEHIGAESINASLLEHLADAKAQGAPGDMSIDSIASVRKFFDSAPLDDVLEITTSYKLADDGSAFRAAFVARYQSTRLMFASPYVFVKKMPRSERTGPIYSNVFVYRSTRLPARKLSTADRARLIAAIEESYRDEQGELPARGTKDAKNMAAELENANDDEFTKDELDVILAREWLIDGGAPLRHEIENAHAFFVKYLMRDLSSTAVPRIDGAAEELESSPGDWIVRRVGSGTSSGTYERIPDAPGDISMYASYGDSSAISRVQTAKIRKLRAQRGRS